MTFKALFDKTTTLMEYPSDWAASASAADLEEVADAMTYWARIAWEEIFWSQLTEVGERLTVEDANGATYIAAVSEEESIHSVWNKNPLLGQGGKRYDFTKSGRGIELPNVRETAAWVQFRPRPIEFTRVAYNGATAYLVDDLVYDATTGQCYRCIQAGTGNAVSDTDYWTVQAIPKFLSEVIRRGAFSELLRNDGRSDRADVEEARAREELDRKVDVEEDQQQQIRRIRVTTH